MLISTLENCFVSTTTSVIVMGGDILVDNNSSNMSFGYLDSMRCCVVLKVVNGQVPLTDKRLFKFLFTWRADIL